MVGVDEPGTSILIPHPKEGVTNPDSLARAIIARWLITIYSGDMVVRIRKNGDEIWKISKETVRDVINSLNWSAEPKTAERGTDRIRQTGQWSSGLSY